jgi:hypothetical protein
MKSRIRSIFAAVGVIAAAGALRMPFEQALTRDFRQQGLLEEPLDIDVKEKIGQNSMVVALAGVRTLVAAFTHLQTTEKFTKSLWNDVEDHAETTVRLSPRTSYYWDIGGWHVGYNASAAYRSDPALPKLRAEAESRRWAEKGREFFERGARNNPHDWKLWAALGNFCSNPSFFPDDVKAADAFSKAVATGEAPASIHRFRLLADARLGQDPDKTLAEIRELLKVPENRVPTLLCMQYALEARKSPPADPVKTVVGIFGSETKALRNLGAYFTNIRTRLPLDGMETAIRLLERRAGIAPDDPKSFIFEREKLLERERFTR